MWAAMVGKMTWAGAAALAASLCLHGAVLAFALRLPGTGMPGPDAGGDAGGIFSPEISPEPNPPGPSVPDVAPPPDTLPDDADVANMAPTAPAPVSDQDMVLPLDKGMPVATAPHPVVHHLVRPGGGHLRKPPGSGTGKGHGGGGGGGGTYIAPTYLDNPPPIYPFEARQSGRTGVVLLEVVVDEAGRPTGVTVGRSSGDTALDHAAVAAVRRWTFHPATAGGRAVTAQVEVPVRFRLK
jgi:protein TonB